MFEYKEKTTKMDAKDIKMLAKKLEKEGDISLEEAKEIVNFFEEKHQELNPDSPTRDKEAADALGLWYRAVEKRLPEYGSYMHTVPLECESAGFWKYSYNPFRWIIKCHEKLSFLDSVRHATWYNFENDKGNKEFKYAGDIRLFPEVYKKVKEMKNVFDRETYVTFRSEIYEKIKETKDVFNGKIYSLFYNPETQFEFHKKDSLYQLLIVRTAFLQGLPIVCLYARSGIKIFMHPSDINKISFLLKYTPDDLIKWAYRKGFLDNQKYRELLEEKCIFLDCSIDICDGFAYECAEIEFLNREDQDEEWVDVIR